jgi:hypothetical protein
MRQRRWSAGSAAALSVLLTATAAGAQQAEPSPAPTASPAPPVYPSGRVTAVVFGDYYFFPQHHDPKFEDQHGFWLRRGYLGYDHAFNERMNARFRLEVTSNGLFAGGPINAVLKDAFFAWRYAGRQQVRIGVQNTLTFESEDNFWGLRHVEKVPADLYLIDSSRDFAVTFSGPVGGSGLNYGVQLGNESGQGSEADEFKVLRLNAIFERSGLRLEGAFNHGRRPDDQDRTTAKALVGYKGSAFRVGAQYLWQERDAGTVGDRNAADTAIAIWSAFGVWDFVPKKASAFVRFDAVRPKRGDEVVGLPGAPAIQYLGLSGASPFDGWIAGLDFTVRAIRLSPNVEYFTYDDDVGSDVAARLTFYWTW